MSSSRLAAAFPRPIGCLALLLALGACGGGASDTATAVPVAAVRLAPEAVTVRVGAETGVTARALGADDQELAGRPVFWSVRDTTIATVTQNGVVRGVRPGTTELAASVQGRTAVAPLTVTARQVATVQVEPGAVQLSTGERRPLTARALDETGAPLDGVPVAWVSSAPQIATVSAAGELQAVAAGVATITATAGGRSGAAAVTVSAVPVARLSIVPRTDTLAIGASRQLTASAADAAGNPLPGRTVLWSSRAPGVAAVSSTGLVTGLGAGTAVVVATADGVSAEATIVVRAAAVAAVRLTPDRGTLAPGGTLQLTAAPLDAAGAALPGRAVAFSSSATTVARVDANGLVTAVAPGTATIRATSEGASSTATITVTAAAVARVDVSPASATVAVGATSTLTATPRAADGAPLQGRTIVWSSGAPSIATVSQSGVVTGVGPGTVQILATVDGVVGTATVTVPTPPAPPQTVASVAVSPASATIRVGGPQGGRRVNLTATARTAGGATVSGVSFTWQSSNANVARVSADGRVDAVAPGLVTITATGGGRSGTATIVVTP